METKENNKLIAEFLFPEMLDKKAIEKNGLEIGKNMIQKMGVYLNDYSNSRYHTSWDWLMPVIIKISKLKISLEPTDIDYAYPRTFGMMNEEGDLMFRFNGFLLHSDKELINAANKATIEYIEWYNEQKE